MGRSIIDNFNTILTDKDNKDFYKASKDTLQGTGIIPSHTQSPRIVNIFNQSNTIINPEVMQILSNHEGQGVIDVDLGLDPAADTINITPGD